MIVKHVSMKAARKSNFADLVKYLTGEQGKYERVGTVLVTNCESDTAEIAALEVLNIQAQNTRSSADKTYHLIVSFRAGEAPDEITLKAIEERICAAVGFADHQRVSIVHHDTDNLHLHIAINKIHPTRYTIHEPFNAYHKFGQLCVNLEKEYGLEPDNHVPAKSASENHAADMERHTDVQSLLGWIQRECKEQMQSAKSWAELREALGAHGLQIRERANGLVVIAENGVAVKASSVCREFSKARLEERLGWFNSSSASPDVGAPVIVAESEPVVASSSSCGEQPAESSEAHIVGLVPSSEYPDVGQPLKRYVKQPMRSRVDTGDLYARYKEAQLLAKEGWTLDRANAIVRKNQAIEDAKRVGRLKRVAIRLVEAPRIGKKLLYAATSKHLREEIDAINKRYLKARQEGAHKYARRSWPDWLRSEAAGGDLEALVALRAREDTTGLKGDTVAAQGARNYHAAAPGHDGVTKKGAIIYCFGVCAVRDDGEKLSVSRGADEAGLQAALRLAMARYGARVSVTGSDDFKEQIVQAAAAARLALSFDDAVLESRRQDLTHATHFKEQDPEIDRRSRRDHVDGRPHRGGDGRGGKRTDARVPEPATGHASNTSQRDTTFDPHDQPDTADVRSATPPVARDSVRGLPELDVVHVAGGGAVLLQGNVPGLVEHQGAESDHGVRRDIPRPGRLGSHGGVQVPITHRKPNIECIGTAPPPLAKGRLRRLSHLGDVQIGERAGLPVPTETSRLPGPVSAGPEAAMEEKNVGPGKNTRGAIAADKYIVEREQKRANGFDISIHKRYAFTKDAAPAFVGLRRVDGQALALLKIGNEIMVLPVDEATAACLKRMSLGQQLSVSAIGTIKTKGRSR